MTEMDKKIQMVDRLLDAIDGGLMDAETIGSFTYDYLWALLDVTGQIGNGKELYQKIKVYLENINLKKLRFQIDCGKKVTVGFIANYASSWIGDELYWLLEKSEEFEPYVFLISNHLPGQSNEEICKEIPGTKFMILSMSDSQRVLMQSNRVAILFFI